MALKYKLVDWDFDSKAWAAAIKTAADDIGKKELAEFIGVSVSAVHNWAAGNYKEGYEWPHMLNLLKVCNLLDLDPRVFFNLEDK